MPGTIPSSSQFTGIRIQRVSKKRRIHKHPEVKPSIDERNGSKAMPLKESHVPTELLPSETVDSSASNNYSAPVMTKTSFRQRKVMPAPDEISSSNVLVPNENRLVSPRNDNQSERRNSADQLARYNSLWKYTIIVICSILGILLLAALLVPSIITYILAPNLSPTGLTQLSRFGNYCAGISSYTLWQASSNSTITMIINTSACNFPGIPIYFVTVGGTGGHFCLTGYDAIYLPTSASFQIYVNYFCSSISATAMLTYASSSAWNINWMGFLYQ